MTTNTIPTRAEVLSMPPAEIERCCELMVFGDDLTAHGGLESETVCDACLRASCWNGELYCEDYKTAGTVEVPVLGMRRKPRPFCSDANADLLVLTHVVQKFDEVDQREFATLLHRLLWKPRCPSNEREEFLFPWFVFYETGDYARAAVLTLTKHCSVPSQ